jgi:hypothetical protein
MSKLSFTGSNVTGDATFGGLVTQPSLWTNVTIAWAVTAGGEVARIEGDKLLINNPENEDVVNVVVSLTVSCGDASETQTFTINVTHKAENPGLTEKTYSYTFTAKTFSANGTKALNNVNWTITGDGGYWNYDGTKGQQLGSGNNPYKSLTVSSDSFSNVSKIKINTSGAKSINATCDVYVGDTKVGTIKLTTAATEYSFDVTDISGEVKFVYTQSSSKAIYIKSIDITYAE